MQGSREQLAIAEFANALLVIPKTLTLNAAKDAIELTARLRALHNAAQQDSAQAALRWYGLRSMISLSLSLTVSMSLSVSLSLPGLCLCLSFSSAHSEGTALIWSTALCATTRRRGWLSRP